MDRWLPQYSQFTEREMYTRHSSLIWWSQTPSRNSDCQDRANAQNAAGTCARTAELSGRGVPSRWQRSISARISGSIAASGK